MQIDESESEENEESVITLLHHISKVFKWQHVHLYWHRITQLLKKKDTEEEAIDAAEAFCNVLCNEYEVNIYIENVKVPPSNPYYVLFQDINEQENEYGSMWAVEYSVHYVTVKKVVYFCGNVQDAKIMGLKLIAKDMTTFPDGGDLSAFEKALLMFNWCSECYGVFKNHGYGPHFACPNCPLLPLESLFKE